MSRSLEDVASALMSGAPFHVLHVNYITDWACGYFGAYYRGYFCNCLPGNLRYFEFHITIVRWKPHYCDGRSAVLNSERRLKKFGEMMLAERRKASYKLHMRRPYAVRFLTPTSANGGGLNESFAEGDTTCAESLHILGKPPRVLVFLRPGSPLFNLVAEAGREFAERMDLGFRLPREELLQKCCDPSVPTWELACVPHISVDCVEGEDEKNESTPTMWKS